jgi:hypothetical protein
VTQDGTVSEAQQKKSLAPFAGRAGAKDLPSLQTIFDFSLTRKALAELRAARWQPAP